MVSFCKMMVQNTTNVIDFLSHSPEQNYKYCVFSTHIQLLVTLDVFYLSTPFIFTNQVVTQ